MDKVKILKSGRQSAKCEASKKYIKYFVDSARPEELDAFMCMIEGMLIERQRIKVTEGPGNGINGGLKKLGKELDDGKQ